MVGLDEIEMELVRQRHAERIREASLARALAVSSTSAEYAAGIGAGVVIGIVTDGVRSCLRWLTAREHAAMRKRRRVVIETARPSSTRTCCLREAFREPPRSFRRGAVTSDPTFINPDASGLRKQNPGLLGPPKPTQPPRKRN